MKMKPYWLVLFAALLLPIYGCGGSDPGPSEDEMSNAEDTADLSEEETAEEMEADDAGAEGEDDTTAE